MLNSYVIKKNQLFRSNLAVIIFKDIEKNLRDYVYNDN
jgi:hypothetical protein